MHACDLHSHEFSPVTPARNIYGVRCVPSCHPASGKHLSYVPLRVQEGVTFLPIPIHGSRRHFTQELFWLSCSGFCILSLCLTAPQLCPVCPGSGEPPLSSSSIIVFPNSGEKANQNFNSLELSPSQPSLKITDHTALAWIPQRSECGGVYLWGLTLQNLYAWKNMSKEPALYSQYIISAWLYRACGGWGFCTFVFDVVWSRLVQSVALFLSRS